MINEMDFYSVLKRIAISLEGIKDSLLRIESLKTKETNQYIKESKQRMFEKRKMINESKKTSSTQKIQSNPEEAVKKILES